MEKLGGDSKWRGRQKSEILKKGKLQVQEKKRWVLTVREKMAQTSCDTGVESVSSSDEECAQR